MIKSGGGGGGGVVAAVRMVVLVHVVLRELRHPGVDLALLEQPVGEQDLLQGREPALVVAPPRRVPLPVLVLPGRNLGYQLRAEALPLERVALRQRHRDAERAALPGRLEDELPVRPRRRRRRPRVGDERIGDRLRPAHAGTGPGSPVPIIASRVTSAASSSSDIPSVPCGAHGEHEVPHVGARVPHADLLLLRHLEPELREHGSRLTHDARPVLGRLVPGRGQPQNRPRVARAQRAGDDVVHVGRILDRHQVLAHEALHPELGRRLGGVLEQPRLVGGVDPGSGDESRAPHWADVPLVGRDDGVHRLLGQVSLLDQERLDRPRAQRGIARGRLGHASSSTGSR